jgi:protein-disulfide isomerase
MKPDLAAAAGAADHRRGVTSGRQLVVYGDFECPYTASAMRDVGRLLEDGAEFEVVFRHFPLRSIHPRAQAAAEAAEAAARQERFWEMHDLLFRNQMRLGPADLRRYAERLGLDLGRFESDVAGPASQARVERDVESGERSGVDGTPSLFIDGFRYRGPRDIDVLGNALGRPSNDLFDRVHPGSSGGPDH